jgi:hypothetical protein
MRADIEYLEGVTKDHAMVENIYFRKYSSLPSFWAYEIESEDVFWGYNRWNEVQLNWTGPTDKCFYFNKCNQPINELTDWINNRFDELKAWSLPY